MKHKVSITIPVKGNENLTLLTLCLRSLEKQTNKNFEVVIVGSREVLGNFQFFFKDSKIRLKKVYAMMDKNSARNIGFEYSKGEFILYLDHDMRANRNLIDDCLKHSIQFDALIIPELGEGGNFWANCRKLEKELIKFDLDTVTPRFFKKNIFGNGELPFDSRFGSLDEWGFNVKIKSKKIPVGIGNSYVEVSEKKLSLKSEIKNKFIRGLWMKNFYSIDKSEAWRRIDPVKRGLIFYTKNIHYLFRDPVHFIGLLVFKSIDLSFFLLGYFLAILGFKESYLEERRQTYDNYGNTGEAYLNKMYQGGKWNQYVDVTEKQEVAKLLKLDNDNSVLGKKLLDLGMGPGRWSRFFLEYNFKSVTGVDISKAMVKFTKTDIKDKRFNTILSDMSDLNLSDNTYDYVFCFRALKYVPNYKSALSEMERVLNKKGKLLLEVPNSSLLNRILKHLSFFIVSINPDMKGRSCWDYFNNVKFFSISEISHIMRNNTSLKLISITPLFLFPSIKLPKLIDRYGIGILVFLEEHLFRFLSKSVFTRSWIVLAEKL